MNIEHKLRGLCTKNEFYGARLPWRTIECYEREPLEVLVRCDQVYSQLSKFNRRDTRSLNAVIKKIS